MEPAEEAVAAGDVYPGHPFSIRFVPGNANVPAGLVWIQRGRLAPDGVAAARCDFNVRGVAAVPDSTQVVADETGRNWAYQGLIGESVGAKQGLVELESTIALVVSVSCPQPAPGLGLYLDF
jgi:hypothetical protein